MTLPLIGVTSGRKPQATDAGRIQEIVLGCGEEYLREIDRAGGSAVILPPIGDADWARRAVEALDGVLLTGGGDIDPAFLNAEPHPAIGGLDPQRDRYEIAIIQAAMEKEVPILGICKGVQILNVALGGGLVQHIGDRWPESHGHRQHGYTRGLYHTIRVEPGTLLAELIGEGELRVNSHHHQAPGEVAPRLRVAARSADGVIEALESNEGRPILGVQFHPELTAPDDMPSRALFEWLVRTAGRIES